MEAVGTHLLLDLRLCDARLLDDDDFIRETLTLAAETAGASVLGSRFHKFRPVGVTGVVLISESHLCIHTWPEHSYAAVDIFTCGSAFKAQEAAETIIERLDCKEPSITKLRRGASLRAEIASA